MSEIYYSYIHSFNKIIGYSDVFSLYKQLALKEEFVLYSTPLLFSLYSDQIFSKAFDDYKVKRNTIIKLLVGKKNDNVDLIITYSNKDHYTRSKIDDFLKSYFPIIYEARSNKERKLELIKEFLENKEIIILCEIFNLDELTLESTITNLLNRIYFKEYIDILKTNKQISIQKYLKPSYGKPISNIEDLLKIIGSDTDTIEKLNKCLNIESLKKKGYERKM